jgi:hypothetical protein
MRAMRAYEGVPKVSPPLVVEVWPWHFAIAKLHELLTQPPIDKVGILPGVVVVSNDNEVF